MKVKITRPNEVDITYDVNRMAVSNAWVYLYKTDSQPAEYMFNRDYVEAIEVVD